MRRLLRQLWLGLGLVFRFLQWLPDGLDGLDGLHGLREHRLGCGWWARCWLCWLLALQVLALRLQLRLFCIRPHRRCRDLRRFPTRLRNGLFFLYIHVHWLWRRWNRLRWGWSCHKLRRSFELFPL